MLNSKKGITLVALVVTIVILIILAGVSINLLLGNSGILTKAKQAKENYTKSAQEEQDQLSDLTSEIDFYKKNVNIPKISDGMIPIKYDTAQNSWVICSQDDNDWYNYIDGMKWANVMLSDGKYSSVDTAGKITATVGAVVSDSDLGSMFVWIPRFAYSINKYKTAVGGDGEGTDGEGTTQNIFNITFLVGTTNGDSNGNTYATDYDTDSVSVGSPTPSIVHPAFTFGENNLTGIWVAKFEASMSEQNNNTQTDNDVTTKTIRVLPNEESWRYICIGNTFLNCLNMKNDGNIYGLTSSEESHLMKNNEWGAVSYLSASQYGTTPKRNTAGSSYTEGSTTKYHSYTAGSSTSGDYKNNTNQSTTGNTTGIYDLNGGAWEYVSAYFDNTNGNLSGQGTSEIFPSNKLNSAYEKYWDKYNVSDNEITQVKAKLGDDKNASNNSIRKSITDDRYNLMKSIKGDGLYEVINTYSYYGIKSSGTYGWLLNETDTSTNYGRTYYNNDFALIGNCSLPFLLRGGIWDGGSDAGVFRSLGYYGSPTYHVGFRPVLAF